MGLNWMFRLVSAREAYHTAGYRLRSNSNKNFGHSGSLINGSCQWGCPNVNSALPSSCSTSHLDRMKAAFANELKDMDYSENAWKDLDKVDLAKADEAVGEGAKGNCNWRLGKRGRPRQPYA